MDANLNFLTAPPANTPQIGGSSGTSVVDPSLSKPMNGKEFAGLMRDLMPQNERQDIAGQSTDGLLVQAASGLQTLNLGSQFAVITAASPLPDPSSLAQFARSQGLSETAVQALFGDVVATDPSLLATANFGSSFPVNPLSMTIATPVSTTTEGKTLTMPTPASGELASLPNLTTLNWLQAHPGAENISEQVNQALSAKTPHFQAGLNLNALSPKVTGLTLDPAVALPAMEAAIGQVKVSDMNALLQTVGANGLLQTLKGFVSAPSNTVESLSDPAAFTEELGPLDAMRMRMVPAWESMTRQLSQLNGTNQAAAWGQLSANLFNSKAKGGECKEVFLDLATDDPDLMAALETMVENQDTTYLVNSDSARNTANMGVLGAAATSAALANPGLTDRAAQIQDMADKLGKAMAERLQDQMEKGEWKLQLKLNPAHLGKIDIELDMRSGSLDAVFKTDNLVTRELISQSMPKLKDSLSESGMTVANVWVNSENQKGSGGNSTPRQNSESDNTVNAPVSEVKAAETRIKELRSSDAWDTLA